MDRRNRTRGFCESKLTHDVIGDPKVFLNSSYALNFVCSTVDPVVQPTTCKILEYGPTSGNERIIIFMCDLHVSLRKHHDFAPLRGVPFKSVFHKASLVFDS